MKFELTVIDNDDKSYRRVWEILTPDGSQSPSGGYHILISLEESIFGERCAEIVAPADAIEAENRREGTYIFVGQCPQIFRTNLACFYEGFGQSYTSQTIYLPNDFPNPENICKGTIIRS